MTAPRFRLAPPPLGPWRHGNVGVEGVWHFDTAVPGRRVLITALVHGNELCGAWALVDLLRAGLRPRRGALTLAFCNLDAFDRFDAEQPDASRFVDEDLNRVWGPALAAGGPTTLERRRAAALAPCVEQADWLLDLHSMHEPGPPLLLTGLQARNLALARTLRAPAHIVVDAGHTEGWRLRDHARFGDADTDTRSLLVECGWHGEPAARDIALDMCARFLLASGAIDATELRAGWVQPPPPEQLVLEVTDAVVARSMDTRFAADWVSGQRIEHAGTVLGWRDGEPFVTPYDGCVLVMPSLRQLRPGATVLRLARGRSAITVSA